MAPKLHSGLWSNVTSSGRPPLQTYPKWQSHLCHALPMAPSTHPSCTHSQLPPPSAYDSLPKTFLWPRAVFILAQTGRPKMPLGAALSQRQVAVSG